MLRLCLLEGHEVVALRHFMNKPEDIYRLREYARMTPEPLVLAVQDKRARLIKPSMLNLYWRGSRLDIL